MDWSPLGKPSLMTRIATGKMIGLVVGITAFFVTGAVYPDIETYTRVGILLWYPTMGAFVGLFDVMNWHPMLQMPLPWWFRSVLVGAWMNFVLVFFAHEVMADVLLGVTGVALSPFWFVLIGALVGAVMGYAATRLGGEGPATAEVIT